MSATYNELIEQLHLTLQRLSTVHGARVDRLSVTWYDTSTLESKDALIESLDMEVHQYRRKT